MPVPVSVLDEDPDCLAICGDEHGDPDCRVADDGVVSDSGTDETGWDTDEPTVLVRCHWAGRCLGGRAGPAWEQRRETNESVPLARWLADAAYDEAGSVVSFRSVAAELERFDLPDRLHTALGAAALDEERHAALMTALARAAGQEPRTPQLRVVPTRTLEAIAVENAVEGCVRETFNALLAAYQARHATIEAIRDAMTEIAADECRHAQLAWRLDAWSFTQLSPAARARVDQAREVAFAAVRRCPVPVLDDAPRRQLGLPTAARARALATALEQQASA